MENMNWQSLLCKEKIFVSSVRVNKDNDRSEFERDYNKIIFSPSFRSLQNKTQLFPIPHSDFIHSRLTHSLEVSSVGRSLGNLVGKNLIQEELVTGVGSSFARDLSDIVSSACLLHDVGNPPFGHAGEDAISSFFAGNIDFLSKFIPKISIKQLAHFDGNAETLRIVNNSKNLNLTLATIASMVKYPNPYNPSTVYKDKHSVFSSEVGLLEKVYTACKVNKIPNTAVYARHPLAFLVEAADDICYRLLDLEDAHNLGLVNYSDCEVLFFHIIESKRSDLLAFIRSLIANLPVEDKFARLRSYVLNIFIGEVVQLFMANYSEIMSGAYSNMLIDGKLSSLIDLLMKSNNNLSNGLQQIHDYVQKKAYSYKPVLEIELAGYEILDYLLEQFVSAVIDNSSIKSNKLINILPVRIKLEGLDNLGRIMGVVDYLAGMTDKFALDLYRKLKGIDLPIM